MGGKEITGTTGVWVHLAHPSARVRATSTVNRAFRERGLDVVAVSSDVAPGDLPALVRGLRGWRNLAGIGVTMPHKSPGAGRPANRRQSRWVRLSWGTPAGGTRTRRQTDAAGRNRRSGAGDRV